jgi:hypothetical protein
LEQPLADTVATRPRDKLVANTLIQLFGGELAL